MSADYKIENPENLKRITITCYHCGRSVNINNPVKGHEKCIEEDGYNRLKLDIDWEFNEIH